MISEPRVLLIVRCTRLTYPGVSEKAHGPGKFIPTCRRPSRGTSRSTTLRQIPQVDSGGRKERFLLEKVMIWVEIALAFFAVFCISVTSTGRRRDYIQCNLFLVHLLYPCCKHIFPSEYGMIFLKKKTFKARPYLVHPPICERFLVLNKAISYIVPDI